MDDECNKKIVKGEEVLKVYRHVHELIGNTPLVQINGFQLPKGVRLFAKLEAMNPGGSVKDRLGLALIDDAFRQGKLQAGGTVIEPTAGNTGIGLALAALQRGINVIVVVPEKFSIEKQEIMKALGAQIVLTPASTGMVGAIQKSKELQKEIPGSYIPSQFSNPANPEVYYQTLGPEIWKALDGKIDVFVAGAGTGGTFMGTARFLKEKCSTVKTVIVEPEGSILNGGEPGPHKTEGIGMEFLPEYMNPSFFNEIYTITDDIAFRYVKELAVKEGLLVGTSSGAAFAAAIQEAKKAEAETNIVVVFPDGSERYLSKKIYEGGI